MSWEERRNDVIGDHGEERAGRAVAGEVVFNGGRGEAAEGLATGSGSAEQQAQKIEGLQQQVAMNTKSLEAIEASLTEVVAQLQNGEAAVVKNPSVAAINKLLSEEAMVKKTMLLAEKVALIAKNQDLEGQIVSMTH